jgi:hypothetical protein
MSDITFFNVDPILPAPGDLGKADQEVLQRAEQVAESLETEFRRVALDCNKLEQEGIKLRVCVDFDVIHSALYSNSFWASVALDLQAFDLYLLPGTLFELIGHISRRERGAKVFEKQITQAFLRAFEQSNFKQSDVISSYESFFDEIVTPIASGASDYLLSLLHDRLKPIDVSRLVRPDDDLFYRCMFYLAEGSRSERMINNRADAYNFSLVSTLNDITFKTKEHYVIVSTAPAMRRLSAQLTTSEFYSEWYGVGGSHRIRTLWTPRYFAIHQLIQLAGREGLGSSALAWRIVDRLVNYRALLSGQLSRQAKRVAITRATNASWNADDLFIKLVSSIESLQAILEDARERRLKRVVSQPLQQISSPTKTFRLIRREIEKFLDAGGYRPILREVAPPKKVAFRTEHVDVAESSGDGLSRYSIYETPTSAWVAGMYGGEEFAGTYFKTEASIEQFVAVTNLIRNGVLASVGIGALPIKGKNETGIIVGTQETSHEFPAEKFDWPLKTLQISTFAGCDPTAILFIRVNTHWFDASYEIHAARNLRMCGIASHAPLSSEFHTFVRELIVPRFRGGDYEPVYRELFGNHARRGTLKASLVS